MQLIGMLDSPYVRRVAISLQLLGLPFEHRSISVFRAFDEFARINPVVKAPTLVCDEGDVLMDSTLILDYAEALAAPRKSLMPQAPAGRRRALARLGLALAACEKGVQIVYERNVRPPEKLHEPWLDRVRGQLLAACSALDADLRREPLAVDAATIDQAGITAAVVWHFLRMAVPDAIDAANFPALQAHSDTAERIPAFIAAPHGATTMAVHAAGPGAAAVHPARGAR
ncbi:MAG: glutathione S-transferase [Caldimonas sp.]